jgi:hypothetical protein
MMVNECCHFLFRPPFMPQWIDTLPSEQRQLKREMVEKYGSPNVFEEFNPQ